MCYTFQRPIQGYDLCNLSDDPLLYSVRQTILTGETHCWTSSRYATSNVEYCALHPLATLRRGLSPILLLE